MSFQDWNQSYAARLFLALNGELAALDQFHISTNAENRMIKFADIFADSFVLAVEQMTISQSGPSNSARLGSGLELRSLEAGRSSRAAARSRAPL